jgi:hypothetical protein
VPFTATFGTDGDPFQHQRSVGVSQPAGGSRMLFACQSSKSEQLHQDSVLCGPDCAVLYFLRGELRPELRHFPAVSQPSRQCRPQHDDRAGKSNLDFGVFKNSYIKRISENFNARFRPELSSILNHANFAMPVVGECAPSVSTFGGDYDC